MKYLYLIIFLLISTLTYGQEIGIRFGEVTGNDVAIDGVFDFNGSRIHANVSFGDGIGIDALYDFVYKSLGEEEIKWYAGVGGSSYIDEEIYLGVSGEIGLEYRFKTAPIAIGFDYRPTFWIIDDTDFEWGGFGLNIRYVF